jgi:hypothetical protein
LGHSICAVAFAADSVDFPRASIDNSEEAINALNLIGEPELEPETDASSKENSSHLIPSEFQTIDSYRVINVDPERLKNLQFEDLSTEKIATTITTPLYVLPNRLPPIDSANASYSSDLGMLNIESIVINHCSQQDDDRSVVSRGSSGNCNTIIFIINAL